MNDRERSPADDFDALLREHGGLQGLAKKLGQTDPLAPAFFEPPTHENKPHERVGLWQRFLSRYFRRG